MAAEVDHALMISTLQTVQASLTRLESLALRHTRRFDEMDQRFDALDQRFNAVDQRFNVVDQRFAALGSRIDDVRSDVHDIIDASRGGMQTSLSRRMDELERQAAASHPEPD